MFRRAGSDRTDAARLDDLLERESADEAADPGGGAERARPAFRVRLHGYDRLEVDNYVARTEWELRSVRRHADHLLDRFGACAAELEIARRASAGGPAGEQPAGPAPERIADILRLAADEAAQMIDAAGQEADRLLAEARLEADARLGKVQAITEMAVARGEEILRAREARDRLEAEAAAAEDRTEAARSRLAAVQDELVDLQRQRDEARRSLRRLTDQIGQVLQAVDPGDLVGARRTEPGVLTAAP